MGKLGFLTQKWPKIDSKTPRKWSKHHLRCFWRSKKRVLERIMTNFEPRNAQKCPKTTQNRYTGTPCGLKIFAPILNRFFGGFWAQNDRESTIYLFFEVQQKSLFNYPGLLCVTHVTYQAHRNTKKKDCTKTIEKKWSIVIKQRKKNINEWTNDNKLRI